MVTIEGSTAHEVIDAGINYVLEHGEETETWGGTIPDEEGRNDSERDMLEVVEGVTYKLTNPRARWSERSRHWPGITLVEVMDDLFAENPGLIPKFAGSFGDQEIYDAWLEDTSEGEKYPHTYGQRLFKFGEDPVNASGEKGVRLPIDQWEEVVRFLAEHPTSRKACFSFWDPHVDSVQRTTDNAYVPCNVFFQVRIQNGELNWHTISRSKDALRGSTENVFEFTLLQELLLNDLQDRGVDAELGTYYEHVTNLHIYQDQVEGGYTERGLVDPYDHFNPARVDERMGEVPYNLPSMVESVWEDGIATEASTEALSLDEPWRSWALALVVEAARLQGNISSEEYAGTIDQIQAPWKISLCKRAYKTWEDEEFVDMLPSAYHAEVRGFQ